MLLRRELLSRHQSVTEDIFIWLLWTKSSVNLPLTALRNAITYLLSYLVKYWLLIILNSVLVVLLVCVVSLQFYTTFWSLSMYDLHVPTTAYKKQVQQLESQIALDDDKDMVIDVFLLCSFLLWERR